MTGTVILDGVCAVEDAEPLLQMLQATPAAVVDWTRCRQLHTAVLQVIMASGNCSDRTLRRRLGEAVAGAETAPKGDRRIAIRAPPLEWNKVGNPTIYPLRQEVRATAL